MKRTTRKKQPAKPGKPPNGGLLAGLRTGMLAMTQPSAKNSRFAPAIGGSGGTKRKGRMY